MSIKTRKVFAVTFIVAGILLTLLPFKLAPVCTRPKPDGSPMICYYVGKIEIILGYVLACLGALMFLLQKKVFQIILSLTVFIDAFLGIAFPLFIIGGCPGKLMECNIRGYPALYLLNGIAGLMAIIFTIKVAKNAE